MMEEPHDTADRSETNWAPTRASTAVALLGTVVSVGALVLAVGVPKGAAVSAGGAICLAVALWLLTFDRWQVPATLGASLLLVPAGAGITAGVGYEALVAFAVSFPAGSPTNVVGEILRIVGVMAVLCGCTIAVFGAVASTRGVGTSRSVSECMALVTRVALLPVNLFIALAGYALVDNLQLGVGSVVGGAISSATDWLFAPTPGKVHLLQFGVLAGAATYAGYRALRDLPTEEFAGEATVGDVKVADALSLVERGLGGLLAVAALGIPVALVVELAVPASVGRQYLPTAGHDLLVAVTSSAGLRDLLWWATLLAGASAAVATLVRRSSRASVRELLVGYAPFVAGGVVVAGVHLAHGPVLRGLIGFVESRLESPLSGRFADLADGVVTFYGSETVVLGLMAGVLTLATVGVFALWLAFALGFVSDRVAGSSLAGGGLFLSAAFAGTVDAPFWLVLAGLVVALVVWDAGEFAVTLGSEVGRRAPTRRVELLHGLSALSVGAVGALAAGALATVVSSGGESGIPNGGLGDLSVALFGAVAGVVLLVMALR
ncbi:DUF7519 family protein [Halorussus lipolyticus]|uniref:DUF7519 family protein n=1 Tax=Halorussus lipolyticus TaxID=3034024 RepID=UPI0023E8C32D|nr:hypothetical protein [Halorussus sp. DT80]